MTWTNQLTTKNKFMPDSPDVRISVTNFGPIERGAVDLRPLTVFVGPSNAGKTYLAVLLYALQRVMQGFTRIPSLFGWPYQFMQLGRAGKSTSDTGAEFSELVKFLERLTTDMRAMQFADLPSRMRNSLRNQHEGPEGLGARLKSELIRCFDLESISDLIRWSDHAGDTNVELTVCQDNRKLWCFGMMISEPDVTPALQIEDMFLFPEKYTDSNPKGNRQAREMLDYLKGVRVEAMGSKSIPDLWFVAGRVLADLFSEYNNGAAGLKAHYLPAARSGIMQSHRVIASSLVDRATRGGVEPFPAIPLLSGVAADFIKHLILFEEKRHRDRSMRVLAESLERDVLNGQILTKYPASGGYPEFEYKQKDVEAEIRLNRASSMVSELAPLVLFLRDRTSRGDMLIIEEPEAHLHPGAQADMAVVLARIVRAGVRVVVTTHSDWLLKEIGNLVREGELGKLTEEPAGDDSGPSQSSLQPSDVGVWLFQKHDPSAGSTVEEIPFDRIEGIEPEEFYSVAEKLYNRSATLQDRLAAHGQDREDG